jgi:HPt (histidine-containing phosphotransfer) domain-containing protein
MSVIDEKTFAELKQMSGAEFINELIDTFLDDSPKLIEEMESALKVNNVDSFRRAAHSLKSNAATFGANELFALAKELEILGKENKLTETGNRLKALQESYESVLKELSELRS